MRTLDMTDDAIHTTVDEEAGRYLGLVSTTLLTCSNTIFAAYTVGHGRGQGVLKKSHDQGRTWSDRLPVPASWSTLLQVPTLFTVTKPVGGERLLMLTGHYPIRQSISDDAGETWTELAPIGDFGGNVSMGSLVQSNSGRLFAFFHDDGRYLTLKPDVRYELRQIGEGPEEQILFYRDQYVPVERATDYDREHYVNDPKVKAVKQLVLDPSTLKSGSIAATDSASCVYRSTAGDKFRGMEGKAYMCVSGNHGDSWEAPEIIAEERGLFLGEPCGFLSPSEDRIAMIMLEHQQKESSYLSVGDDSGKDWTKPRRLHPALNGFRHVARKLPDGRLIVVFGTRNDSHFPQDVVAWVGTYEALLRCSDDFCLMRIKENLGSDFGYSGLEVFPDGTCVTTTYGSWLSSENRPSVISSRFNPLSLC